MNTRKVYKNDKVAKAIRESYNALLKAWKCEVREFDIEGKYGKTHVLECGSEQKAPLILFHGVGDDAALMWVYNAKELCEHFHVYAIDTIGGPGKSVPGEGYDKSFEDSEWIDEILDFLNIKSSFMAGVSNGAYLVQMYSIYRPERVIKGICMASGPSIATDDSKKNGKSRAMATMMKIFLPEALLPTDKNVKKLLRKMTGDNYQAFTDNEIVFRHFKQLMTGFNRVAMMNHKVRAFSKNDFLSIKDKVRFIVGKKDPFMILGGMKVFEHCPADVIFLENAGHGINHEKAEEVNKLIIDYLK